MQKSLTRSLFTSSLFKSINIFRWDMSKYWIGTKYIWSKVTWIIDVVYLDNRRSVPSKSKKFNSTVYSRDRTHVFVLRPQYDYFYNTYIWILSTTNIYKNNFRVTRTLSHRSIILTVRYKTVIDNFIICNTPISILLLTPIQSHVCVTINLFLRHINRTLLRLIFISSQTIKSKSDNAVKNAFNEFIDSRPWISIEKTVINQCEV